MSDEQDRLFANNRALTSGFRFDEQVVKVFPDMIARSVPGYELVVPMIGLLARRYAQPDSQIYDLGCSLGAASLAMSLAVKASGIRIIAIDNSEAMVGRCKENLVDKSGVIPIDVRLKDILDIEIENASVVVLNFTLQFLGRDQRQSLINRISAGMREGGALIISEKICFEDVQEQTDQTTWHHDFKRAQGYSDLEIAQKRNALEDVLRPETEASHFQRLQQAGFPRYHRWFQCFSFVSYIAFK
ncbi:MAG: carboxy-S-adenosyl-L-methionine synthase CmoA [Xanthomonadales bacterium]|nr:carboxy-S-adenosyl-L-methionine synthase CmoA [Xanthomonadales bacterium]